MTILFVMISQRFGVSLWNITARTSDSIFYLKLFRIDIISMHRFHKSLFSRYILFINHFWQEIFHYFIGMIGWMIKACFSHRHNLDIYSVIHFSKLGTSNICVVSIHTTLSVIKILFNWKIWSFLFCCFPWIFNEIMFFSFFNSSIIKDFKVFFICEACKCL